MVTTMVRQKKLIVFLVVLTIIGVTNYYLAINILIPSRISGATLTDFNEAVSVAKASSVKVISGDYSLSWKMVAVYGKVIKVLSRDLVPPRHERFIITDIDTGESNLTVIYNVDYLSRGWLNVQIGDYIVFIGEVLPNAEEIHKVAEGFDFLVLYRPTESLLIEVGFYPPRDTIWVVGIFLFDILLILATILILKKKFISTIYTAL